MRLDLSDAEDLFRQGAIALAHVEAAGLRIDVPYLEWASGKLKEKIKELSSDLRNDETYAVWRRRFGERTNLGSPMQLGEILFDVLKLPYEGEHTKTGQYRVDKATLATVDFPFARKVAELEEWKDVLSTNLNGIRRELVDGFLHPFFHLSGGGEDDKGGARSYRGSSSAINFQSLRNRNKVTSKVVRRCFIPREGGRLAEIDFSGHEFRVGAAVWGDPAMIEYASNPKKDIHRDMAAKVYMLRRSEVSSDARYCGKNGFVFPKMYGSYHKKIARHMWNMIADKKLTNGDGVSLFEHLQEKGIAGLGTCEPRRDAQPGTFEHHVRNEERAWERMFPDFTRAGEQWAKDYERKGGFPLVTGFWVSGVYSRNAIMNYPVQGAAFHCLLWALIRLQKWLRKHKMRSLIVGQIHDCILLDCPSEEVQDVLNAATWLMTIGIRKAWKWLTVPLAAEVSVTDEDGNWFDKKLWVETNGTWGPK